MDKQQAILDDLKQEAKRIKNGIIIVEFKVHQEEISLAEIVSERKKLG